ncbi:hypothetical protein NM208_g6040 [Fusarium decemcellulare]|uniref:Uncharacterized protein n=1 Tax=Fusarium decemcellulare TaxID=57161 RepID=A0ACC1SEL7_9HYPO|nr:hypothetical protein NM208_g6040 [Fusarium decemcellulare]
MTSKLASDSLRAQSSILPWDGRSHASISPAKVKALRSGAGTNPTVLLNHPTSKNTLQNSKLWFFMTDGAIDERLVNKFANAIPTTGLHGTASVIILFGYPDTSPFKCNVSVGMSVFAVAPHCVFLFHDVQSGGLYVFQAKGSFTSLLPKDSTFTSFGPSARWKDLTRITYDDLCKVKIPRPDQLGEDIVVLPGGKKFDMTAVYNNTLSKDKTIELLSDYPALDVILLAARTRGRDASVKAWIESARKGQGVPDVAFLNREDTNGKAKSTMNRLLNAVLKSSATTHQPVDIWHYLANPQAPNYNLNRGTLAKVQAFRSTLRNVHEWNWRQFSGQVRVGQERSDRLNEAAAEVLLTINSYDSEGSMSPAILTPMSSPAQGSDYLSPVESLPLSPPDNIRERPQRRYSPLSSSSTKNQRTNMEFTQAKDLLFLPGFRAERTLAKSLSQPLNFYDTCSICQEPRVIQTILLQSSASTNSTPGLPEPGHRAGHKYPLLLGNFPETDIILPITSCDACASALLQSGELPNGDRVAAALPLVSLSVDINRELWEKTLAQVYGHRFHNSIVFLLFLSTVCATFEDLDDNQSSSDSPGLRKSLEWCCKEICKLQGLSLRAGLTPAGSPLANVVTEATPLEKTLLHAFCGMRPVLWESTMFSYPMDGFLVLVRLARLMNNIPPESIERFVWKRLLYYFTEQHTKLQNEAGVQGANAALKEILHCSPASREPVQDMSLEFGKASIAHGQLNTIALMDLCGTYLFPSSSDILEDFQRTGEYFQTIQDTLKYRTSIAVFLHLLLATVDNASPIEEVPSFFTGLQYEVDRLGRLEGGVYNIFEDSGTITEKIAAKLITKFFEHVK